MRTCQWALRRIGASSLLRRIEDSRNDDPNKAHFMAGFEYSSELQVGVHISLRVSKARKSCLFTTMNRCQKSFFLNTLFSGIILHALRSLTKFRYILK
ncbi:hypothetical protein KIN20_037330 [Parelaphostrongylus tenuis]|uniref:Uncharacterized protein n=1 Tax=Parelaphostrongylus tenuis TaxID=148309 RepID=A0AAD5WL35_PARTN|nr:hypothetical protein KIN20_037330 [Parelaphostrongylus tenuis]